MDRYLQFFGAILLMMMGWVLNGMLGDIMDSRSQMEKMNAQLAELIVRVEHLEKPCNYDK